jgi:hypothetical protein
LDHPLDNAREVLLGSSLPDPSADGSRGDLDGGNPGLGAVALVREILHRHRLALCQRKSGAIHSSLRASGLALSK